MNNSILVVVLTSAVVYGTPLLYAALGELIAERSGVLNLGVEGMMLMGAVLGFWAVQRVPGGSTVALAAGIAVAAAAGAAMALIHAFLVISLRANQIVSGLALTIFAGAAGLSSYLGNTLKLADQPARYAFGPVFPKSWRQAEIVGPILLGHSILVYASWVCVAAVAFYLWRTRPGAGWIAIALVIFAFWRPWLCLLGAYFFGAFSGLPFTLQARGVTVAPELFQALPYVMTVVVLVLVSSAGARRRLGAPAALGASYVREER